MKQRLAARLVPTAVVAMATRFVLPLLGFSPAWALCGALLAAVMCLMGGSLGSAEANGSTRLNSSAFIVYGILGIGSAAIVGFSFDIRWLIMWTATLASLMFIGSLVGVLCYYVEFKYLDP